MTPSTFIEKFENMPKKIQKQILEYAERILKTSSKSKSKFSFDWEGGLRMVKESSVELQHKANEWR